MPDSEPDAVRALLEADPHFSVGKRDADNFADLQFVAPDNSPAVQAAWGIISGTSMATPVVSGTVALMLQANPNLTPNMVKMVLQYTAQPIIGFNMLEQGAGNLNIEGAIRLAKLIRPDLNNETPLDAPMLTAELPVAEQTSQIAGENFLWSRGLIFEKGFGVGTDFITRYQRVYGLGFLISDGLMVSDGFIVSDGLLMSDGLILSDGRVMLSYPKKPFLRMPTSSGPVDRP